MRPPEFTGGNDMKLLWNSIPPFPASMRPPEFTGENITAVGHVLQMIQASMRPPEFTGGNMTNELTARSAIQRLQ